MLGLGATLSTSVAQISMQAVQYLPRYGVNSTPFSLLNVLKFN